MPRRVLVAVDSRPDLDFIRMGVEVAQTSNARLEIVCGSVSSWTTEAIGAWSTTWLTAGLSPWQISNRNDDADDRLERLRRLALARVPEGVPVEVMTVSGSAVRAIGEPAADEVVVRAPRFSVARRVLGRGVDPDVRFSRPRFTRRDIASRRGDQLARAADA